MRIWLIVWGGLVGAGLGPRLALAQTIRIDVHEAALETALEQVREQGRVDIVFAQRLVQGRRVTCHYLGPRPEEALACLLGGTGLRAEAVRRRQYVLVALPASEAEADPPVRGLLTGFLADATTDAGLPGAHVYLPDLQLGTVTNEAGYFALSSLPRGVYSVRFSYVGYEVVDSLMAVQAQAPPAVPTILLQPVALEATDIVVEAARQDQADRNTLPGAGALPAEDLEKLPSFPGEPDLFQALQWLPGVQKTGELGGGLVVRGGDPDQNLYLLDGAPVYHPWHAFTLLSTFQTEAFKDVRLYRGAFPAEYGGRLSSVVDVHLKDGRGPEVQASAALSVLSGRFTVEAPLTRNSSFMLSGRRSYIDKLIGREHPVESQSGVRDTLRTGYYFYDLSAKYSFHPSPDHRFSLSHYRGRDDLDLRLPFDLSLDFSSWLRPAELFFEVEQNWGNQVTSLRHQYLYSRRFFLTTTAYHSAYRASEGAFIQPTSTAALQSDYRVFMRDLGLKADADFYATLSHQLRAGLQVVQHRFRSGLDATVQRSAGAADTLAQHSHLEAWEAVAYLQDVWQPSPRWQVLPGVRASFFSGGRYTLLSPRLSTRYAVHPERFMLRAAVSQQVQYLHRLRDRYSFMYDLVSSRWIPASAAVKPASSVQVAGGGEARPRSWLRLSADVYWRMARQVLVPEDAYRTKDGLEGPGIEVGTLLGQYVPARARAFGVELGARLERGPWQLWLNYSGGRSFVRADALGEPRFRPADFDVPRALQGVASYTRRRWGFTLAADWRSGYPHTVPVARYVLEGPLDDAPTAYLYRPYLNNGRLPPYLRLDFSAGYRFQMWRARWQVQVHLYNLANRRNVVGRRYDPAEAVVTPVDRYGLPFLPLVELEVKR